MAAIENEHIYALQIRESANDGSDFGTPDVDYRYAFLGEDGQLHVKDSADVVTGIGGAVTEITDLPTADTTTTKVLAPDGAGGVEWRAESGAATATEGVLSGDVTIVNANQFYDGPNTGSLGAGTYVVTWKVAVQPIVTTSQNYAFTAKMWDGSTTYDETPFNIVSSGNYSGEQWFLAGVAKVTLGGAATLKVSVTCNRGSSATQIARNIVSNGATSNHASVIVALKIS